MQKQVSKLDPNFGTVFEARNRLSWGQGQILKPKTWVLTRTQVRSGYGHDKVRGDNDSNKKNQRNNNNAKTTKTVMKNTTTKQKKKTMKNKN